MATKMNGLVLTALIIGAVLIIKPDILSSLGLGGTATPPAVTQTHGGATVDGPTQVNINSNDPVTVTFSSWDFFSEGTNAGTGHRILQLGGKKNLLVNDDGTQTASKNEKYVVLIGNVTTSIANAGYYPVLVEGNVADAATDAVSAGQYKADGAPTF